MSNEKQGIKRRFKLNEQVEFIRATKGVTEIELSDGTIITIDPRELWDDAVLELASTDPIAAAKALVKDAEKYELFVADGGSAATLFAIISETQGVSVGESLDSSPS